MKTPLTDDLNNFSETLEFSSEVVCQHRGQYFKVFGMRRWLIDDFGKLQRASPEALAAVLGLTEATVAGDLLRYETYAIVNVGLIVLESSSDAVTVRCRPAIASERAIGSLSYWLLDHPGRATRVKWYDAVWHDERVRDGRTAIGLLSYLLELKRIRPDVGADRIRAQPSMRAARRWNEIKAQVAAVTARPLDAGGFGHILDPLAFGRWSVVDVDRQCGAVHILDQGTGYPILHPLLSANAAGRSLEALADEQYREWVLGNFRRVAASGQTSFDDIDAVVHWPRLGDLRTRYWRILTALPAPSGRGRVLSMSGNDSGIDLRPENV